MLTDEAVLVAKTILDERGVSHEHLNAAPDADETQSPDVQLRDQYANSDFVVLMATCFFVGLSKSVRAAIDESSLQSVLGERVTAGAFYALIGGVASYFIIKRRAKEAEREAIMRKYKAHFLPLLVLVGLVLALSLMALPSNPTSPLLYGQVIFSAYLGIAVFKRQAASLLMLAGFAALNVLVLAVVNGHGVGGFLWTGVFYLAASVGVKRQYLAAQDAESA